MADVILKNAAGEDVTYPGVERVDLPMANGQTAHFAADPAYVIHGGDALTALYFNTAFDMSAFRVWAQETETFTLTMLTCKADDTHKLEIIITVEQKSDPFVWLDAKITQGESVTSIRLYYDAWGVWAVPVLDLRGYAIGTVERILQPDAENGGPLFGKAPAPVFGRFPPLPPYCVQPGSTFTTLYFNPLSADAMAQIISEIYSESQKTVEPATGVTFGDIGLGMMAVEGTLLGLSGEYIIMASGLTAAAVLYSTVAFDLTSMLPGFAAAAPGWQVESYTFPETMGANYDVIPPILQAMGIMHCFFGLLPFSVDPTSLMSAMT